MYVIYLEPESLPGNMPAGIASGSISGPLDCEVSEGNPILLIFREMKDHITYIYIYRFNRSNAFHRMVSSKDSELRAFVGIDYGGKTPVA